MQIRNKLFSQKIIGVNKEDFFKTGYALLANLHYLTILCQGTVLTKTWQKS